MIKEAIKGQDKLKIAVKKLELELFKGWDPYFRFNDNIGITIKGMGNFKITNIKVIKNMTKKQSKDDYIKMFCFNSGITKEQYLATLIALPCSCEDAKCKGWATVLNNSRSIKSHNDLYA